MKHKCPRCGDVRHFKDAPLRQFAVIGLVIGLLLGAIAAIGFVQLEISPQWITDQTAINQTNLAFQYGTQYGSEYVIATITNKSIQCKQIPMNYSGYQYTLVAVECLNLNKQEGNQNG